ncbi:MULTISPECIES: FadR/GntR family transcriptional regulator [unclassified Brachybacterium]|uniref:FadR/GntR family transcriptional regulator n=1 Tax=unclassified Brachybacterium TaxID=2623841 RepID=UPI00360D4A07
MSTPSPAAPGPEDDDGTAPPRFGPGRAVPAGLSRSPSSAVTYRLLDLLLGESMRPGDRLPGERALAESLGVGRSAVREAISALEVLGVVETRAGSGTYLRSNTSELLPSTLSWSLLMDQERTAELSVVRGALERSAAQLAALSASAEQKAELVRLVEEQRAAADDAEGYVAADVAFHRVLAQIAGNGLIGELLATTRSLLRVWFDRAVDNREDIDRAIEEHDVIARAIAAGDATAAAEAMERHMATATERILRGDTATD